MPTMVITGATGALGSVLHACAENSGWRVIPITRNDCDVMDDASVARFFDSLPPFEDYTSVVHAAGGIIAGAGVEHTSAEDVSSMLNLNLVSAFNIVRHTAARLQSGGNGSYVFVGSKSVVHPVANRAAYTAAKAGLAALSAALAEEGRLTGLRSNVVLPGVIRTEANLAWGSKEEQDTWITPEAVSDTIITLCGPLCAITGATIPLFGKESF